MTITKKQLLNRCFKNIRIFGEIEDIVFNFRNFLKLRNILAKKQHPSTKLLSSFHPLNLRRDKMGEEMKKLRKKEAIYFRKLLNRPNNKKTVWMKKEIKTYCYAIIQLANKKMGSRVVSKMRKFFYKSFKGKKSSLRKEYALWMCAVFLAKKLKIKMPDFKVKPQKSYIEPIQGIIDFLGLFKEIEYITKISQGIDAYFDKKKWRKRKRTYNLPKINSKASSFEIKLNEKEEFKNIINE